MPILTLPVFVSNHIPRVYGEQYQLPGVQEAFNIVRMIDLL